MNLLSETEGKAKHILSNLDQFIGTVNYYRHFTGIVYTDGIQYLAESCGAYWLIDVIASYQAKAGQKYPFQIWRIRVNADNSAVVDMREDSDREPAITQEIRYTDFPLKEYEVYCIDGVILLKNEY